MVEKSIVYRVDSVQFNPRGGELFGLLVMIPSEKQGGILYLRQVESQF